jgi:hypothetical protein
MAISTPQTSATVLIRIEISVLKREGMLSPGGQDGQQAAARTHRPVFCDGRAMFYVDSG